jgi:ubiquinone biosynthesis protein
VKPDWFDTVLDFQNTPVASASIGQVHFARHADGTPLAVKIVKEDFKPTFLHDLATLRRLMRAVLFFYPKLQKVFDPMGVLAHIEEYTLSELDLRNEMEGQAVLARIADTYRGRHDLSLLRFAHVYPELSGESVLVSEFVEGTTFDRLLEAGKLNYDKLLDLFSIHGLFLFGPGVFHGDIHPGNIILKPDGTLCFLDTGAISRVGKRIRRGLFKFFMALCEYDYASCAARLNEMAEIGIDGRQFKQFENRFFALYSGFQGKSVSEVSLTQKMMQSIKLAVNCGMVFEKGMFPVIKSMMYLDGMVLRCKPEANLIQDMKPRITEFQRVLAREEDTDE